MRTPLCDSILLLASTSSETKDSQAMTQKMHVGMPKHNSDWETSSATQPKCRQAFLSEGNENC